MTPLRTCVSQMLVHQPAAIVEVLEVSPTTLKTFVGTMVHPVLSFPTSTLGKSFIQFLFLPPMKHI